MPVVLSGSVADSVQVSWLLLYGVPVGDVVRVMLTVGAELMTVLLSDWVSVSPPVSVAVAVH